MRGVWVPVLTLLLTLGAGCLGPSAPVAPGVIAQPPHPEPVVGLSGVVVDAAGLPVSEAWVWPLTVDLRNPMNNSARHLAERRETGVATDGLGAFRLESSPGATLAVLANDRLVVFPPTSDQSADALVLRLPGSAGPTPVAHRAGALYAPENTLAAIEKALLMRLPVLELDVRMDADGRFVLLHDATLDRTTDARGPVTLADARRLGQASAGAWFHATFAAERVPTLGQAFSLIEPSDARIFLDVKSPRTSPSAYEQALAEQVRAAGMLDRVYWGADNAELAKACVAASVPYCMLKLGAPSRTETELVAEAIQAGVQGVHVRHDRATAALVDAFHAAGIQVFVGTANDAADWARLVALGVDFVGSDDPAAFAASAHA